MYTLPTHPYYTFAYACKNPNPLSPPPQFPPLSTPSLPSSLPPLNSLFSPPPHFPLPSLPSSLFSLTSFFSPSPHFPPLSSPSLPSSLFSSPPSFPPVHYRLSYDITVELEFPGTNMKSTTSYDLKNPNFRYMTTPLPVPGTLYSNPTENYYQDYSTMQHQDQPPHSMSSTSHSLNPVASQAGISSTLININPVPTQLITSTPAVPQITNTLSPQLISSAQSLNPAAPHFVPLPLSDNKVAYHNGGGLLSTPRGQQMVYSQCSSGITGVMYNSVYSSKYGGHHWNQQYSSYY